jgi:hypothetical protein
MSIKSNLIKARRAVEDETLGLAIQALDDLERDIEKLGRAIKLAHKIVDFSVPGQKEERLEGLGPYAKTGWLRIHEAAWYGLTSAPSDQWQVMSLREAWRDFPQGTHDDRLDGVDGVIRVAREFSMVGDVELTLEAL